MITNTSLRSCELSSKWRNHSTACRNTVLSSTTELESVMPRGVDRPHNLYHPSTPALRFGRLSLQVLVNLQICFAIAQCKSVDFSVGQANTSPSATALLKSVEPALTRGLEEMLEILPERTRRMARFWARSWLRRIRQRKVLERDCTKPPFGTLMHKTFIWECFGL